MSRGNQLAARQCNSRVNCNLWPYNFYCCPYHWIFAVDTNPSMGFNLNKVWMIRWWFRWWLYWWWCPQKISTFGFSSSATVNEEFQWDLNPILPPRFSSPQTHYSVAIIKALQLIVRYSKMNQCLLIFSDGGDNSFDSAEIEIWNFVRRNCLECDLCVQCFFMRNFRNQQVPNNYMNTCR